MNDDKTIDKIIESLERLVEVEQRRRGERNRQRQALRERIANKPDELEKEIPKFDVNKVEDDFNKRRSATEERMRESLEREKLLLSNLARQTQLLEEIVAKLEARS